VATADGDTDFLVASLERSIADLKVQVEVLEAIDDLRGGQFIIYLRVAVEGIASRAASLLVNLAETADPIDHASVDTQLRRLHQAVELIHSQTGPVIGLRTPAISHGTLYFVREAADAIVQTKSHLIVRPDSDHTFSTLGQQRVFAGLFSSVRVGVPDGALPVLIQYPWIERANVALHVLFLHELGHEAAQRLGLTTTIWARHPTHAGLDDRFADVIERILANHAAAGRSTTKEDVESTLRSQFASWVEEVVCDAIATAYIGPSYLFAFVAFLGAGDKRASSHTHPPISDRIRYVLAILNDLGWMPILNDKVPLIGAWVTAMAEETARPPADDHGTFVAAVMSELAPVIRQVAIAHIGSRTFSPREYQSVGDELELLVQEGIPPIQLKNKRAAGRREMFLAVWLGTLARHGGDAGSIPKAVADPTFQALHAQAIELSFLLEDWARP
jgi:hypothetical protein